MSDRKITDFFNNLYYYYQLNPQPPETIPTGEVIPRNTHKLAGVNDISNPTIIRPDGFWYRNVFPPPPANPNDNIWVNGFASKTNIEISHSCVYDGSVGVWYYYAPGSGIYVSLGNSLISRNKLDALRKLGFNNQEIANSLSTHGTGYWPASYNGELPSKTQTFESVVTKYMNQHGVDKTTAENAIIDSAIEGTNYEFGRINDTGWQVDQDLYNNAINTGYDTVQFTTQANMNNGWDFEIMDVRCHEENTLESRMASLKQYYSIRNPFNLAQFEKIEWKWPFYNLYSCSDKYYTMSDIAKYYNGYNGKFQFPTPGVIPAVSVPGYPKNECNNSTSTGASTVKQTGVSTSN